MRPKKVLSTRKIPSSFHTKAKERGVDIDEVEMITVNELDPETISGFVNSVAGGIVVFTSRTAISAVANALHNSVQCKSWKIYTLCGASGTAVRQLLGKEPESAVAKDGAELASIIIAKEKPTAVSFFCGNLRRDILPSSLSANGFAVTEHVVYKTSLNKTAVREHYDGVMFFSPSAVKSFFDVNKIGNNTVLFSIGNTTAMEIRKYSRNKLLVAPTPDETTMMELVTSIENYI